MQNLTVSNVVPSFVVCSYGSGLALGLRITNEEKDNAAENAIQIEANKLYNYGATASNPIFLHPRLAYVLTTSEKLKNFLSLTGEKPVISRENFLHSEPVSFARQLAIV